MTDLLRSLLPLHYWAVIDPASPRREAWLTLFGTDALPVESAEPEQNYGSDDDELHWFYAVDVARLDEASRRRLIDHLSKLWRKPSDEVIADLYDPQHGLPIQAEDVRICLDPDQGRAAFLAGGGETAGEVHHAG